MQLSKSLLQTMGLALGLAMSTQNVSAKTILAASNECPGDSSAQPKKVEPQKLEDKKIITPEKMLQETPLTLAIDEELGLVPAETDTKRKIPLKKETPKKEETIDTFSWENCGACCGRG
jgi:hypothetical protein